MQPTPGFVRAVGNRFEIDGHEFKFVGFNIRGLAHYGFNDFLPLSTVAQRTEVLAEAQAVGSRVIRIFLPFFKVKSDAELVNRLRIVLDNAVAYQQRVIVCFTDHFESIKLQHWSVYQDPPDYRTYLYVDKHQNKVLNPDFYARLYRGPFLTYVRTVVSAFKNHPAVFAWELTNEGSDYPDHNGFIAFHNNMAAEIRAIDPNHMITAGIVSIAVVQFKVEAGNDEPARLYQNLDFITIHDYDPLAAADQELARRLNKPFIIEEAGRNRQRAGFFRENMAYWFEHGASGYMGWGFMPSRFDNQDGDVNVGIDRVLHGDYEEVTRLWKDRAATFPPVPPPAPMPASPPLPIPTPPPAPGGEYFVEDARPANDPSLAHVPRLATLADILIHFAPLEIDQKHGWQATPAGKGCWKVVGFRVAAGEAILRPRIRDQNGQYVTGKLLHWHYPGAPAQLAYGGLPPYFKAGLSGKTKPGGVGAEFGLNESHQVQPGQGGPDSIWVATGGSGPEFSDAVHKLGVRLPYNLVVSPIFQHVVKESKPAEPPSPPPAAHEYHLAVVVGGVEVGRIPLSQAQTGQTHLALYHGDTEIGRILLAQNVKGQNYIVLRDREADLGRASW